MFDMKPIGYIKTCFRTKNGVPRQGSLSQEAKATLNIEKSVFTNPDHSILGLEEFSYIWVIFIFHENRKSSHAKAKVHPPRLNGKAVGVFSTRSPHRPNPIGLSLVRLERIEGCTLHLAGIDLLDGTPIIDIKPYIPSYDCPVVDEAAQNAEDYGSMESVRQSEENCSLPSEPESNSKLPTDAISMTDDANFEMRKRTTENLGASSVNENLPTINAAAKDCTSTNVSSGKLGIRGDECNAVKTATWLHSPPVSELNVVFTVRAEQDLSKFHCRNQHDAKCDHCLDSMQDCDKVKIMITETLKNDPRSVYRRNKCQDRLYYYFFDNVHVTSWFDDGDGVVEVLRVSPLNTVKIVL